ncbi:MAG: hypothetical protein GQ475_04840 [Methylococcaceae bacterium]|nr:hypothetical protein [Methylococcaceae bacterium]
MSESLKTLITKAIQHSPSADNSQPWQINWKDNSLFLNYDTDRVANKTFPADSPAIILAMGAALENIKQITNTLNIAIEIDLCQKIDLASPCYFKVHFGQTNVDKEIETVPFSVFNRHTNRFSYSSKPLSTEILHALKNMSLNHVRVHVITDKADIKRMTHLVRMASEIRFKTKEVNEWLGKSLRFGNDADKTKDGLDVATLDLPPGGSLFLRLICNWKRMQFLNLFGTYITMSFIDSAPVKKAPALIAITAPSSIKSTLEAGQLMEKVWIELNKQGIAVHPYYVICDQLNRRKLNIIPKGLEKKADKIASDVQDFFQFKEDETLQMLFRVGIPEKKALRSQRLPFSDISTEL